MECKIVYLYFVIFCLHCYCDLSELSLGNKLNVETNTVHCEANNHN